MQSAGGKDLTESSGWLDGVRKITLNIFEQLEQYPGEVHVKYPNELAALATMCCKLQYESLYRRLLSKGWFVPKDDVHYELPQSCYQGRSEMQLSATLKRLGLCASKAESLDFVRSGSMHSLSVQQLVVQVCVGTNE